jgi:uncharacterized protein (TIGR03437 family)
MYTTDFDYDVVYKIDPTGVTTIVAGTYQKGGFLGDGGLATSAMLNNPSGVAPAPDGTLYIADYTNQRIRKVATNGTITTFAGTGTAGFTGDGGQAASAELHGPIDPVVDSGGNLWFIDYFNLRIRKITPAGIINTIAGFGTTTYSGDGGSVLQAGIWPGSIALGPNGNYYFTDEGEPDTGGSCRVRMVNSSGTVTTVAGTANCGETGDGGAATAAELNYPDGVTIDSSGNLYIAEYNGARIRKVSPGGTITTYAGTGVGGFSGDGGPAIQATFNGPRGMAVDSANNIYIADQNNHRIRKISGAPAIATNGVVNGASFASGGIVPGEIATVFGANLTTGTGINLAGAVPLATSLINVQVLVNGTAAPIFAVDNVNGQEQVNFQVPYEIAGQTSATLQVVNNNSPGNTITVPVMAAQPGMFTYTVGATTYANILHASYQLANTSSPATPGETVLIYCTGLGAVSTTPADGAAASGADPTVLTPTVTIGGATASIAYTGLAPGYVGLYQINVVVPSGLTSGNQPVIITLNGVQSAIALLPVM